MGTSACFLAALETRRSIYNLSKNLPESITQASLQEMVEQAVKLSPSPFDIQSARVVILWGGESDRLWEMVWGKVKSVSSFADGESSIDLLFLQLTPPSRALSSQLSPSLPRVLSQC